MMRAPKLPFEIFLSAPLYQGDGTGNFRSSSTGDLKVRTTGVKPTIILQRRNEHGKVEVRNPRGVGE